MVGTLPWAPSDTHSGRREGGGPRGVAALLLLLALLVAAAGCAATGSAAWTTGAPAAPVPVASGRSVAAPATTAFAPTLAANAAPAATAAVGTSLATPSATPPATPTLPRAGLVLLTLRMFDPQHGLAMDDSGRLLVTADGGASWQSSGVATIPHLDQVSAVVRGTQVAFVAGGQALLVTTDGGRTYQRRPLPASIRGVDSLSFPDAQHGWLMANVHGAAGSESVDLFATADAGQTWTQVANTATPTGTPGALGFGGDKTGIAFRDDHTGWLACTCGLLRTSDEGRTWEGPAMPLPSAQGEARAFTFYPPSYFGTSDGVFVLLRQAIGSTVFVYRTHDGGATWQMGAALPGASSSPSSYAYGGFVWAFADAAHGWVVQQGHLFSTTDGGANWRSVGTNANLLDVWQLAMLTPQLGWAVQYDQGTRAGQLLRTADGGRTWAALSPHLAAGVAPTPTAPH